MDITEPKLVSYTIVEDLGIDVIEEEANHSREACVLSYYDLAAGCVQELVGFFGTR